MLFCYIIQNQNQTKDTLAFIVTLESSFCKRSIAICSAMTMTVESVMFCSVFTDVAGLLDECFFSI